MVMNATDVNDITIMSNAPVFMVVLNLIEFFSSFIC